MERKRIVAIGLTVCAIILAGTGVFLLISQSSLFTPRGRPAVARSLPYNVHRSQEVPISLHRAYSTAVGKQATELLPWGIAIDYARGYVWVGEPGCEPKPKCSATTQGILGLYAYSDSTLIQNFSEPAGYSSPLFVALDKDGTVWFTEPATDAIGEFNMQSQTWNQWLLKRGSGPFDLIFDSTGNLWFTEFGSGKIGFFNTQTDQVVENAIPTPGSNPYGITKDPAGNMWFNENGAGVDQIGNFTPTATGVVKITEHTTGALRPHLIAADRAGNIWYSGGFDGDIGEFQPRSGITAVFVVHHGFCVSPANCTGTHISGIYVDSKGNVWFTDSLSQRVGYLVPSTGQVVARTIHISNSHPNDGLLIDTNDRVWFIEEFALTLNMWPASAANTV